MSAPKFSIGDMIQHQDAQPGKRVWRVVEVRPHEYVVEHPHTRVPALLTRATTDLNYRVVEGK